MDAALVLKIKFDKNEVSSYEDALSFLNSSEVVKNLLQDFDFDTLGLLNRLNQITEIPYMHRLDKVQAWLNELIERSYFGAGFSYSGEPDTLLACYNAMITSVLIRLQFHDKHIIDKGIQWILNYQNVARGCDCKWQGASIKKYGGCMKSTPCYVGLVKSMIALSDYKARFGSNDKIEAKLLQGIEYMLEHELYLKLSNKKPITSYITKLSYPFTVKTNTIELLRLLKQNNKLHDKRCKSALENVKNRARKGGYWQINAIAFPKGWVFFDRPKEKGEWISYCISNILSE